MQNKDQRDASAKLTSLHRKLGQNPLIFQPGSARTTLGPNQNVTCDINRFYTQILVKTSNKMNIKTKI
jgi:hypothetical protein